MKDYVTVIAAVVAGIFALISAYLAWKLKSAAEASERSLAESRQRRQEMADLYANVIATLEQSIKTVQNTGEFSLDKELSEINGKLHLLASEAAINQYHDVAERIRQWSSLHRQASPRRMSIGGDRVLLIQAPDPTEKFKQPALDAYRELQDALERMIKQMRAEVRGRH